jgi:hypothetical protein
MTRVRDVSWWTVAVVMLGVGLSAGCATSRPAAETEVPPLVNPAPPPRLLPPLAGGPIEAASPSPTPEAERPAQAPRRRDAARPADASARPEARPADLPKVEPAPEPPRPAEEAQAPAPVLQLSPADESGASEPAIRQQLTKATQDLSRVDYGALSVDAKAQYDTAKRFMILADHAIRDRNFVFARTLADKAAVIAGVLLSR